MAAVLFVLLIAVPLAELYVIVQVADGIGLIETIVLLIGVSLAGAWLLKQQGLHTWARLQDSLAHGKMPHRELVDGVLIVVGGALLLTPGFLTDAVGLLFLFPPTRAGLKRAARRLFARWARNRVAPGLRIFHAAVGGAERGERFDDRSYRVTKVTRSRSATPPRESPPALPPDRGSDEDDSPGRG
ncbi:MAG TPA: FxsA family protein [Actinomycetota bacterium]|nr:FxsA family protein [Actinomycetota bacterium]